MRLVYLALGWCAGIMLANSGLRLPLLWLGCAVMFGLFAWRVRRVEAAALLLFALGGLRMATTPHEQRSCRLQRPRRHDDQRRGRGRAGSPGRPGAASRRRRERHPRGSDHADRRFGAGRRAAADRRALRRHCQRDRTAEDSRRERPLLLCRLSGAQRRLQPHARVDGRSHGAGGRQPDRDADRPQSAGEDADRRGAAGAASRAAGGDSAGQRARYRPGRERRLRRDRRRRT